MAARAPARHVAHRVSGSKTHRRPSPSRRSDCVGSSSCAARVVAAAQALSQPRRTLPLNRALAHMLGGESPGMKVMIIGLDCAEPSLVLERGATSSPFSPG